jgi:hypothetical protein
MKPFSGAVYIDRQPKGDSDTCNFRSDCSALVTGSPTRNGMRIAWIAFGIFAAVGWRATAVRRGRSLRRGGRLRASSRREMNGAGLCHRRAPSRTSGRASVASGGCPPVRDDNHRFSPRREDRDDAVQLGAGPGGSGKTGREGLPRGICNVSAVLESTHECISDR